MEGRIYTEHACRGIDNPLPGTCTVPIPPPDPKPFGIIVGATAGGVAVIAVFAFIHRARRRKDPFEQDSLRVTGESVPPEQVNELHNDGVGSEFGNLNPFQQLGCAQVESESNRTRYFCASSSL